MTSSLARLSPPRLTATEKLIMEIFDFFFPEELLCIIVESTNAKAAELCVKERTKLRLATDSDRLRDTLCKLSSGPHVRYRDPSMVEGAEALVPMPDGSFKTVPGRALTVNELRVFLGSRITMGGFARGRVEDFWSTSWPDGDRLAVIADAMTLNRFKSILSHLSFLRPGYTGNPAFGGEADKLFKLREVNDMLGIICRRAWDVEPDFVPDESRLRLSSRYCTFTTTMNCKPIKTGLTNYAVCFCRTKYLYAFEWFTGKAEEHGRGQPTDMEPLDEGTETDKPAELSYILGLLDRLVDEDFDDTFATMLGCPQDPKENSFPAQKGTHAANLMLASSNRSEASSVGGPSD